MMENCNSTDGNEDIDPNFVWKWFRNDLIKCNIREYPRGLRLENYNQEVRRGLN